MAMNNLELVLKLLPALKESPFGQLTVSYDEAADVLYVDLRKGKATDSQLTDDDVIVRYDGDEVIGYTLLHASQRAA
jgi:uncharacterized protein YuzE